MYMSRLFVNETRLASLVIYVIIHNYLISEILITLVIITVTVTAIPIRQIIITYINTGTEPCSVREHELIIKRILNDVKIKFISKFF